MTLAESETEGQTNKTLHKSLGYSFILGEPGHPVGKQPSSEIMLGQPACPSALAMAKG